MSTNVDNFSDEEILDMMLSENPVRSFSHVRGGREALRPSLLGFRKFCRDEGKSVEDALEFIDGQLTTAIASSALSRSCRL